MKMLKRSLLSTNYRHYKTALCFHHKPNIHERCRFPENPKAEKKGKGFHCFPISLQQGKRKNETVKNWKPLTTLMPKDIAKKGEKNYNLSQFNSDPWPQV